MKRKEINHVEDLLDFMISLSCLLVTATDLRYHGYHSSSSNPSHSVIMKGGLTYAALGDCQSRFLRYQAVMQVVRMFSFTIIDIYIYLALQLNTQATGPRLLVLIQRCSCSSHLNYVSL